MPSTPQPTARPRRTRSPLASAPVKLAGFAALLVALFGAAALAGAAIDPDRDEAEHGGDAATATDGGQPGTGGHTGVPVATREDAAPGHSADEETHPVRGLAVAETGLRLVVASRELRRARTENVRFRIVDERGQTVRDFDVEHTKRMHVIVVRRDLAAFQHLHPTQNRDGAWSVPVRLPRAGSYRLFADFSHEGQPATLASDLHVDGQADLHPLPPPAATAISGGYEVRLKSSRARPGSEASLQFTIAKGGQELQPEPYLGAGGHLVALRDGDLAFLHVHPTDHGHGHSGRPAAHDDPIAFAATFPSAGRYRLFLQFKHNGTVQTVAFTQEVK